MGQAEPRPSIDRTRAAGRGEGARGQGTGWAIVSRPKARWYNAGVEKGYTVILSPDPDGPWTAICPAMPGAITEGESREAALSAMQGVMVAWLDIARREGFETLTETSQLVAEALAHVLEDRAEEGWELQVETTTLRPQISAAA